MPSCDNSLKFARNCKVKQRAFGGPLFLCGYSHTGCCTLRFGEYQLATPRELNFCEIEKKAQKYYDKKFASATDFLFHTKIAYDRKTYPMTSFMLHQATEYFIKTIPLVFAL